MESVAERILGQLKTEGYDHFVGVPCSLLKGLFQQLEENEEQSYSYIPAVREDSAVGVASGMVLGGKKSVVLMQNSGLGYCLNVLTSFNFIYDLPVLLIVSWRGAYGNDAVEHDIIGDRLTHLLDAVEMKYVELNYEQPEQSVRQAIEWMEQQCKPVAILLKDAV